MKSRNLEISQIFLNRKYDPLRFVILEESKSQNKLILSFYFCEQRITLFRLQNIK